MRGQKVSCYESDRCAMIETNEEARKTYDAKKTEAYVKGVQQSFKEGLARLTRTEKRIFMYYAEDRSISDIPKIMFISMETVKKHNREIYRKFGVSTNEELKVYIRLLKGCGLMDELLSGMNTSEGNK